jgi:hypothetical protein
MQQRPTTPKDIGEPLSVSAALARQWACESCVVDAQGHRCDGYHGLWQTLRLVGLGATLGGHADTYVQAMQDIAREWNPTIAPAPRRLLISGCADYSMLAHVLHAFAQQAPPHITVLDICPTPVRLNGWYAQRVGLDIELVCADLLQHQPDAPYDLVVTSSLLGFFSPDDRSRLFAAYARMMHPGASLVFSNRLRPEPESKPVGFKKHDAEKFADKVAELAAALPGSSKLDREVCHAAAALPGQLCRDRAPTCSRCGLAVDPGVDRPLGHGAGRDQRPDNGRWF